MKITGPDKTSKTSGTKKAGGASSTGASAFSGLLGGAEETTEAAHTSGANAIARLDSLLAAQGAEDPAERASRGRMKKRADSVLRGLDKVRLGILTGNVSVGNLIDIADVVASHRERIQDPQLAAILDEIDLRAQIEIAKMRMALDASKML
ncbi:MAG: flagellar assembly protein FliX [Micavibrio aeruginosavorus]|uniref:Flagellar assembly protein FliX n=1 Tax=Micavibrio aeruginosavorus TaxID=349221 RepID=A0A2W5FHV7_9BACT|nr:MAG: flagellar assembly protein FliX [Micavibrio aeruginosavorus]